RERQEGASELLRRGSNHRVHRRHKEQTTVIAVRSVVGRNEDHMRTVASSLLVAAALVALAAAGCQQPAGAPGIERPAPPGQFAAATSAGVRFAGPAARIDIRYVDPAGQPAVEVMFSAAGGAGETWSVQAAAPAAFLETQALTARVVDGPLAPGTATVQLR